MEADRLAAELREREGAFRARLREAEGAASARAAQVEFQMQLILFRLV